MHIILLCLGSMFGTNVNLIDSILCLQLKSKHFYANIYIRFLLGQYQFLPIIISGLGFRV